MTAEKYLIGIDTGGTYTDAAIIAEAGHKVIASAKALTTKGDFAIGVVEAVRGALASLPKTLAPADIALISVSTTLATNAVVEGHGSAIGVALIGFDAEMVKRTGIAQAFPGMPVASIAGGHDHNGDEQAPLDALALTTWLGTHGASVDAFAIASAFATRNPAHERQAREIVAASGRPVTISTELSSALDAPRRALTTVLNARLIARLSALIAAVERAMAEIGIACPLMIVKGDGTLALAQSVAARPIETVLSGPAASLVGAQWLSGLRDFVMSDMGGTTTDVGILLDGRPKVLEEGAEIGGWRTMVRAADIRTLGLGGDSEIKIAMDGTLTIGPQRVVPVSLIGARYPETLDMLAADLADNQGGSMQGKFVLRPFGTGAALAGQCSDRERDILETIGDRPKPLRKVALSSGMQRGLANLARRGLVQLAGFTPSDAAHVLGLQDNWSREAARLAAQLTARFREMKAPAPERVEAFAREVWSETVRLSGRAILATTLGKQGGEALLDAVCAGDGGIGLTRIAIAPTVPVVAVGGPVKVYYPEVGRRLGCDIVFAPHCDVANAVGAAVGAVARTVTVTVDGDGAGAFHVHGPAGTERLGDGASALERATVLARETAKQEAEGLGASDVAVRLRTEKHLLPDAVDDNGIFRASVMAEAVGRPRH